MAAALGFLFPQTAAARETRRELSELPDDLLRDIGLNRGDISFAADAVASGRGDPTRDALDRLNWSAGHRAAAARSSAKRRPAAALASLALASAVAVLALAVTSPSVPAGDARVERGKYLVTFGGCHDCHTPGYFFGKPDMKRFLGGSEVGFEIPGLGVFHGPNLTPDRETGIGRWSSEEIATAITTGKRPDGRILAPIMPWHAFAALTGEDVGAVVAFLKSLPPVKNKVPGPFGPTEKPTSFVMKIVAPEPAATALPAQK